MLKIHDENTETAFGNDNRTHVFYAAKPSLRCLGFILVKAVGWIIGPILSCSKKPSLYCVVFFHFLTKAEAIYTFSSILL